MSPTPLVPGPARLGSCPHDGTPLDVYRIHLPGWRTLVEGSCPSCGHDLVQDLPAGHGLFYPATLDLTDGTVTDPAAATWFSGWLADAYAGPDHDPVALRVDGSVTGPARLVNCLDPVYGHALLRLLSLEGERARTERALVAVVPRALAPLVPDLVAATWIVDEPLGRLRGWLTDLDRRLHAEIEAIGDVDLAATPAHPHPSTWHIETFVGGIEPERGGDPSILLSLRDDRTWGPDAADERVRVAELASRLLADHPRCALTAIGLGEPGGLPDSVLDLRSPRPAPELECRWLACMRGSDLAIGVHGSNMLLPSGLARATLELLGAERHSNAGQATLITQDDPVLVLARHRTIYGDRELADVGPGRVAEVATAIIDGLDRVEALMTGPAAGVGDGPVPPLASEPRRGVHAIPPAPEQPTIVDRAAAVSRAAVARGRDMLRRAPEQRHTGALPAVLRDRRGVAFEISDAEEADAFVRNGGHFEGAAIDLAVRALRPGEVAVDVGANIGAFSAAMAGAVGPAGRVVAFEPFAGARERLIRTLELNGLGNVDVVAAAVADRDEEVELVDYGPGFESWSTLVPRQIEMPDGRVVPAGRTAVPGTTLDRALEERGVERVAVLKIDVEGAEGRVVAGARTLLSEHRADVVLLEVSDDTFEADDTTARAVLRQVEGFGYATYELTDPGLVPWRPVGRVGRLVQAVCVAPAGRERLGLATVRG